MISKIKDLLIITSLLSVTIFFSLSAYSVFKAANFIEVSVPVITKTLKERDAQFAVVIQSAAELSKSTSDLAKSTYWDNYANIQRVSNLLGNLNGAISEVRKEVIPSTNRLLAEASLLASSTRSDLSKVSDASSESFKKLDALLVKTEELVGTAQLQTAGNGEALQITLQELSKTITDVDKLVTDPNVVGTLKNIEAGTKNTAEITQSVDTALRPLRTKVGLLKKTLFMAFGLFRINLNPMF